MSTGPKDQFSSIHETPGGHWERLADGSSLLQSDGSEFMFSTFVAY